MSTLFIIGLSLILIFGFSSSAYIAGYKMQISSFFGKAVAFVLLGAVISFATFTISLAIIWPPAM